MNLKDFLPSHHIEEASTVTLNYFNKKTGLRLNFTIPNKKEALTVYRDMLAKAMNDCDDMLKKLHYGS